MASLDTTAWLRPGGQAEDSLLTAVLQHQGLGELIKAAERADVPCFVWDRKTHEFSLVVPLPDEKFNLRIEVGVPQEVTLTRTRITDSQLNGVPAVLISGLAEPLAGGYFSAYALSRALDSQPKLVESARLVFDQIYNPSTPHQVSFPAGAMDPAI